MADKDIILEVRDLKKYFKSPTGTLHAVDGVNFSIRRGETLGLVGESGCGKSVTSLSIMQLLQRPQGQVVEGEIRLNLGNGKAYDITKTPTERMQNLRGNYMSMIFQEPMVSLDPLFPIGDQLGEVGRLHKKVSQAQANEMSIEMLRTVGIPSPETRLKQYPFELSGGMQQRVGIAAAMLLRPRVLLADEPTAALDVSAQKQVLEELLLVRESFGTAVVLVSPNLGLVAAMADRVLVMRRGEIVEAGETRQVLRQPRADYTRRLLEAVPKLRRA